MKSIIKKIIPTKILILYHYFLAKLASLVYGFPSRKMIIIGVTGTKGKTSAANFIWSSLSAGGIKTGIITTANIRVGDEELINDYHMTMPGRFAIQKYLRKMYKSGCKFCVVETTSQGLLQYRHVGVNYDIAVFTNLSPEHLESHNNSFDEYREMKGRLFESLLSYTKTFDGKTIDKIILANYDDENKDYFLSFKADKKITFGALGKADVLAEKIEDFGENGLKFNVSGYDFKLSVPGMFNVYNALPAIIISRIFGVSDQKIYQGIFDLKLIPGRMEKINEGQNFFVFVDYAHEGLSMKNALLAVNKIKKDGNKTIVVLGAEGGGRDKAKRQIMGQISGELADYVVVTNVDPYDDDPEEIIENIATACQLAGKIRGQSLFTVEDRQEAIKKAFSLANAGDVVLITGKGAEQSIEIKGKKIAWDDRLVSRQELKNLKVKIPQRFF